MTRHRPDHYSEQRRVASRRMQRAAEEQHAMSMKRKPKFGWTAYGQGGYETKNARPVAWTTYVEQSARQAKLQALPATVFGWIEDPVESRDYPPDVVLYFNSDGRPTETHEWESPPRIVGGEVIRWFPPSRRGAGKRYRLEASGTEAFGLRDSSGTVVRHVTRAELQKHLRTGRIKVEGAE